MFQIDRSYINSESLESLQGRIWDIRMDHKDDPTLPKLSSYNIKNEDEFEAYLERKQNFLNFKDSWKKNRLLILGITLVGVLALWSLFIRKEMFAGYIAAVAVCTLIVLVYQAIEAYRAKQFRNNPCETFIKALIFWDENHEEVKSEE